MSRLKNFKEALPEGYEQVLHINAKDKKTGLILNLWCLVIAAAVIVTAVVLNNLRAPYETEPMEYAVTMLILAVSIFAYIVLHELVHGAAYKISTGERLTFGISWSCAFCGVPNIYVYRRASIFALAAPLTLFTVLLLPLTALFYFVLPIAFIPTAVLLAFHLGGCVGDGYMLALLLFKYRDKDLLVKDTGPEQFLYIRNNKPL